MTITLNGTPGNDNRTGFNPGDPANPDGIEVINGAAGDDTLTGLGGNDTIEGGLGADSMDGGAGFDTLSFANAAAGVWVNLNAGAFGGEAVGDTMTGFEAIVGSAFNDIFGGDGGNNTIDGGAGTDIISISGGADVLDGGADGDYLDCRTSGSAVIINVATGIGGGGAVGTTFANFENIIATNFNDILTAAAGGSTLGGLGGDDTINGGDGNDVLLGDDFLNVIGTSGVNSLSGGAGNDFLQGGALGDVLNGGAGSDTASYENSNAAVIVNVDNGVASGGHAQGDTLIGIENVLGSTSDDFFGVSAAANFFDGRAGADGVTYVGSTAGVLANLNGGIGVGGWAEGDTFANMENLIGSNFDDTLYGNGVNNILDGGVGDDVLDGLVGADTLQGGNGSDTASYSFSAAGVVADLTFGVNSGGDAQGDVLQSIENLTGSAFADTLRGDAGANVVAGGAGGDQIAGYGAADAIDGGAGVNTVYYDASTAGVRIDLDLHTASGGDAHGDTLTGVENLVGSALADVLIGDAGANALTGGGGDDQFNGHEGADSFVGGAGVDTVFFNTSTAGINANLTSGVGLGGDAAGDAYSGIENIVGSAFADAVNGDAGANSLDGGGGDDVLQGRAGADTLQGGAGIDTATYGNSAAGVQIDLTLHTASGGDAQGDVLQSIENLTGSAFADTLRGDAGANVLAGGAGDDAYVVDDAGDQIVEGFNQGTDTIRSSIAYTLGADVENLVLTVGGLSGTGNGLANLVRGNQGNETLDGAAGADTMSGGKGDDLYVVDDAGDVVVEDTGHDTVQSSISYVLGAKLEDLELTGSGAINGFGNDLANALTGNAAANHLNGLLGADTMTGGGGDDAYVVDNAGDLVVEFSGGGFDRVAASVSYTLSGEVENLVLTGAGAIDGTGNGLANTLSGNVAANRLDGAGGADVMSGGAGDDFYVVDDAGDKAIETAGAGVNTIEASVTFVLATHVENLVLTGAGAIDGFGNDLGNSLTGNGAANLLNGLLGADTMTGGGGADIFAFNAAIAPANVDQIVDFTVGEDIIRLDRSAFAGLPRGVLADSAFTIGAAASDASDRIVYDDTTGKLLFDQDGAGGAAGQQFATLATGLALSHLDFLVA